MSAYDDHTERLLELLGARQIDELTPEERDELDSLIERNGIMDSPEVLGELLLMLDAHGGERSEMPEDLRERIALGGRAAISARYQDADGAGGPLTLPPPPPDPGSASGRGSGLWIWLTGVAALLAIGAGIFAYSVVRSGHAAERGYRERLSSLQAQVEKNQQIIASSRAAAEQTQSRLAELSEENRVQAQELASKEQERVELAARLAEATTDLNTAQLKIAKYETPTDPAVLAQRRRQLLEVPDSIQIAWQPFDLPDSPAEQHDVRGDVVWSDELQEGYIRFVGLDPNDPNIEQYQVWVIDQRGMEQKVSGGVFNASSDGEIIVPIEPGIDVGRVALFAVTVENPGGTWVPDLSRRVVVAPRDEG